MLLSNPLRCLCLLALASLAGAELPAQDTSRTPRSSDALIVASARERAKFYAEASYDQAIAASLAGYRRAVELDSLEDQVLFLRHLTFDNWLLGNSENALANGFQLLRLANKLDSVADRSRANRYLSQIYTSVDDLPRAAIHARAALAAADLVDDDVLRAYARECIGLCALRTGDFATARHELEAARRIFVKTGQIVSSFVVRREQAELAAAEGDLAGALAIFEEVEAESVAGGNPLSIARALDGTATQLRRLGRAPEALARLERAAPLVAKVGSHSLRREFFTELALTREALGDPAGALAAERAARVAREAMAAARTRAQAAEAEAHQALEARQQAIDRLNAEKATQAAELRAREAELGQARTVRTTLVIGAAVFVLVCVIVIVSQRARLRARRLALEETRHAQILAEDAGVLKTRLLAIASHDLKGPLRSVARRAETIERVATNPADVVAAARLVRSDAQRMFDLVRDLLDLAAIESGSLELHRAPLDLGRLTTEVVARHAPRAEEKTLALQCEVAGADTLHVVGDAARLAQAIDNVVDNAVKYTPIGGAIRVSVARREERVEVTVADTGPGLSSDEVRRMFQPFQRFSAQPTGGETSTGLGLHIARDFIGRHGGTVEVDSAPGRGATFTLVLPAAAAGDAPAR